MKTFGEWLTAQRKSRNWRQEDLAARLSITKRTVGGWERNVITPHSTTLARLAAVLGYFPEAIINPVLENRPKDLPPIDALPAPMTLSAELSAQITDLASRAAMDPETWLHRAVDFFAAQREAMFRELRPAETSQLVARLSGTHGMRIAATDSIPGQRPPKK